MNQTPLNQTETLTFSKWLGNVYHAVVSTVKGLLITFRYVWAVKPVTVEYPEVRDVLPERARMRLYNDAENCISCTQCALACPVDCIYIASTKRDEAEEVPKTNTGHPKKLVLTQFTIDEALCCYCGLCTTVCPTECLTHSHEYEFSTYDLNTMKYDYLDPKMVAMRTHIVKNP